MSLAAIGVGLQAAGLAGSLLGKKKKASVDTGAMRDIAQRGTQIQKDLIGQQFDQLKPMTEQYGKDMEGLSASIEPAYAKIGENLKAGYQAVAPAEQKAIDTKLGREQEIAARNIPLQQQLLREQLAATGNLRTGSAGKALQAPVQQAAEERSDLASQLQSEAQSREASRLEKGTEVEAELAKEAFTTKLGLDRDTFDNLLQLGRTDLIEKLSALRGVSAEETQNLLGILGVQTNADLADAAASNASQQNLYSGLSGLGGSLLGYASSQQQPTGTVKASSLTPQQQWAIRNGFKA